MIKHLLLFLAVYVFRLLVSTFIQTYHDPDEFWQSIEPAHRIVFGRGYLTWEWQERIRSILYPMLFTLPYRLIKYLELDYVPFTVQHVLFVGYRSQTTASIVCDDWRFVNHEIEQSNVWPGSFKDLCRMNLT